MSMLYGLSYLCDMLLYFGCLGCLGFLGVASDDLFFVPVVLFAACAAHVRLRLRATQKHGEKH